MREQELGLLHVGLSWTIEAAWPFLAKSARAGAVIVPFDFGDDLKYPDLVMIIPLRYLPTDDLQEFQRLLELTTGQDSVPSMNILIQLTSGSGRCHWTACWS